MIASLATLIGNPYAVITGWTLLLILLGNHRRRCCPCGLAHLASAWIGARTAQGGGGRVQCRADPRGLYPPRPGPESASGGRSSLAGHDVRPE